MSGRKLNALEQKLHQAALADPKKTLTQKECEVLVPDPSARTAALNFLLGTGLLKAMKDTKGSVSFRAVMKKELDVKKDMSGEEAMILSYIQAAGNEGIWTKHLKAKTELHQTVIDRCLKSLSQKQLIKSVKSVKYPTRKIYMLAHLEPSVEMTGGPWYTDNELDTEFIKLLCSACLRFIRDRSAPKQRGGDASSASAVLYPISAAPAYPTAQQVLTFLSKSRITETQLNVEHVEMLLNVLVLDGEIERVPAFGAAMWDTSDDRGARASDDERSKRRKRKAREAEEDDEDDTTRRRRKRSKRSRSASESESESSSESESESESEQKRRRKRKSREASSGSESEDENERRRRKRARGKRSRGASADEEEEDVEMNDEEEKRRSKGKSRSRSKSKSKSKGKSRGSKRRKYDTESGSSASGSESSDSDSDTDSDTNAHRRSRSRSKSKSKSKSRRSRSSSPAPGALSHDIAVDYGAGGAYVYRAVRQERAAGGLSQSPCVRCPTFDFCKPGGPVNPQECTYYGAWLAAAEVGKG
ncbi:RNA polymerase Rpc34 subunit-domain-containing protein [Trametes punicea]|nr:RNA polymerase Rpc34 subunit-domain-containing protein [Trametes punicea]